MKGATTARPSVRTRCQSRKANRLEARLAAHDEFPVAADGSHYTNQKPKARRPGSRNPRKH